MSLYESFKKVIVESILTEDGVDMDKLIALIKTDDMANIALAYQIAQGQGIDIDPFLRKYQSEFTYKIDRAARISLATGQDYMFEKYFNDPILVPLAALRKINISPNMGENREEILNSIIANPRAWRNILFYDYRVIDEYHDRYRILFNGRGVHPAYFVYDNETGKSYTIFETYIDIEDEDTVLSIISLAYPDFKYLNKIDDLGNLEVYQGKNGLYFKYHNGDMYLYDKNKLWQLGKIEETPNNKRYVISDFNLVHKDSMIGLAPEIVEYIKNKSGN